MILGSWSLESFEIEDPQGNRRPWGAQLSGLLIYAPTGHMSASINKEVEQDLSQSETENLFDAILFYAGTYSIEGSLIKHQVAQASNPSRIGRELLRYAKLEGDLLSLSTPVESFGQAHLVWRRIRQ